MSVRSKCKRLNDLREWDLLRSCRQDMGNVRFSSIAFSLLLFSLLQSRHDAASVSAWNSDKRRLRVNERSLALFVEGDMGKPYEGRMDKGRGERL